jgi:hypothetical protein
VLFFALLVASVAWMLSGPKSAVLLGTGSILTAALLALLFVVLSLAQNCISRTVGWLQSEKKQPLIPLGILNPGSQDLRHTPRLVGATARLLRLVAVVDFSDPSQPVLHKHRLGAA